MNAVKVSVWIFVILLGAGGVLTLAAPAEVVGYVMPVACKDRKAGPSTPPFARSSRIAWKRGSVCGPKRRLLRAHSEITPGFLVQFSRNSARTAGVNGFLDRV